MRLLEIEDGEFKGDAWNSTGFVIMGKDCHHAPSILTLKQACTETIDTFIRCGTRGIGNPPVNHTTDHVLVLAGDQDPWDIKYLQSTPNPCCWKTGDE